MVITRTYAGAVPTYSPSLTAVLDREPEPPGGVRTSEVDYAVDGTACRGFLAVPAGDGAAPGVLVLGDWSGSSDHTRMRCEMLARLGFVALAGDVYGGGAAATPEEAPRLAGSFYADQPLWRTRVVGAFERLLAEPRVDRSRTAAVGYCFGGAGALQLARTGADVTGVVSFHGSLQTGPEGEAAGIRAKLLVLTGAVDPVVPGSAVTALEDELRAAPGLDWQVTTYAGAMHAFTLPDADAPEHGAQFDATAERRSWAAMRAFFDEVLA